MIILTFKESLSRIDFGDAKRKDINDAVRSGLVKAADWLIETNLRQRKFTYGNRARYGFAPRSRKYENRKRFARKIKDPETGLWVTPAKPSVDLVYTGRLRDFIKSRGPEQYRKIATATSNRIRLRVPIQVPGRKGGYMKGEQFEELGKWSQDEYLHMRRIIVAEVARVLGLQGSTEQELWRRAD